MSAQRGWIGVDLDGTLAEYHGWQGAQHIGEPVPLMVRRVTAWLAAGQMVKVFTARVGGPDSEENARVASIIHSWCLKHIGIVLPVTCTKDYGMVELWDDRAVQVIQNTGRRADGVEP